MDVKAFLDKFSGWASLRPDIEGVALVGSYARDVANEESDVDLIILTKHSERYISDQSWASAFGEVGELKVEDWGRVKSLRVFYKDGLEVEYSFALPDWADIPVDVGTHRVVSNGMKILFDPRGILGRLKQEVFATLRLCER
ncbi:MAG TPA: nucleotidyltransferase domain-containing protein [Pyrinomonadaceae bacterium]|nr:nucleotidyltransferase domain-containing protein [Pyrinomonadaceae bacterium]